MPRTRRLILLAEDYKDTRDLYTIFLSRAGYQVEVADDGLEVVGKALELLPDLIIMDLSMPGMDGVSANCQLKSDERSRYIPVVLLTAYSLGDLAKEVFEAGFAGFLTKPCMPADLIAEIDRVLCLKESKD